MSLKILTVNVNGIQERKRRRQFFEYFLNIDFNIFCLQETHASICDSRDFKKEWPGFSYWNSYKNRERGVCILIKKNFPFKHRFLNQDNNGRILSIVLEIEDKNIQLLNIYGPNFPYEREQFFHSVKKIFLSNNYKHIMLGDFNQVINSCIDRDGPLYHTQEFGKKNLEDIFCLFELIDVYRNLFPLTRVFTFENNKRNFKSRIDRIYIDKTFTENVQKCEIINKKYSDHKMPFVIIDFNKKKTKANIRNKKNLLWKMNTSNLEHSEYQILIIDMLNRRRQRKLNYIDILEWWDAGKILIRQLTQTFSIRQIKIRETDLKKVYKKLEKEYQKNIPDSNKIEELKSKIESFEDHKFNGYIIRSRETIIENQEMPTKFFFKKEKENQNKKFIEQLTDDSNNNITDQNKILKEIKDFFQKLYKKANVCKDTQNSFFANYDKKISNQWHQILNSQFTKEELKSAVFSQFENKSPGDDGIPIEFYKTFFEEMKTDLLELINEIFFVKKAIPISMQNAIITMIPKKGNLNLLKNWRPISLLNSDYKILEKLIANRITKTLNEFICEEQVAAIPKRNIHNNLIIIRDLIDYSELKEDSFFILSIDQQKAFDMVDREFLFDVLKKSNYPDIFISFIQALYFKTTAQVKNGNSFSKHFDLTRGLRQGGPLSLILYVIKYNVLVNEMANHTNLTGIDLPGIKRQLKMLGYADDSNFIGKDLKNIKEIYKTYEKYERATGSKINQDKTEIIFFGNKNKIPSSHIYELYNINEKSHHNPMKILGIYFGTNNIDSAKYNFEKQIGKIKNHINILHSRTLSLRGKAIMINTELLSKIWYLSSIFPIQNNEYKKIEKLIFNYIWKDSNSELIKRETLYLPLQEGGLGILNVKDQNLSLRLKYSFQIISDVENKSWTSIGKYWLSFQVFNLLPKWNKLAKEGRPKNMFEKLPIYYQDNVDTLKNSNNDLLDHKPTTQNIRKALNKEKYEYYQINGLNKWRSFYQDKNTIKNVYKHQFKSYAYPKYNDLPFKILHYVLRTNSFVAKHTRGGNMINKKCKFCKIEEDIMHVFKDCPRNKNVWQYFEKIFTGIKNEKKYNLLENILTINALDKNIEVTKLVYTLDTIILFHIWKSRNKNKYENKNVTTITMIKDIKKDIVQFLKINFKKLQNDLETFKKQFCINNILCSISLNNELIIEI